MTNEQVIAKAEAAGYAEEIHHLAVAHNWIAVNALTKTGDVTPENNAELLGELRAIQGAIRKRLRVLLDIELGG